MNALSFRLVVSRCVWLLFIVLMVIHGRLSTPVTAAEIFNEYDKPIYRSSSVRDVNEFEVKYLQLKEAYDQLALWSRDEGTVRAGRALREDLGDVNNIALVSSLNDVGLLMVSEGRLDRAEEMYRRALVILDHVNGRTGAISGTILQHLADVAWRKNDLPGAASFYQEAEAVFAQSVGTSSPRYAAALNGWAVVLHALGKTGDAETKYREALGIYEEKANRNHSDGAVVQHNLGLLLMEQGRLAEAGPLLEESVKRLERPSVSQTKTMIALRTLARCHQLAGNRDEAAACEARADDLALNVMAE